MEKCCFCFQKKNLQSFDVVNQEKQFYKCNRCKIKLIKSLYKNFKNFKKLKCLICKKKILNINLEKHYLENKKHSPYLKRMKNWIHMIKSDNLSDLKFN